MVICPVCSREVDEKAIYCPYCQTQLAGAANNTGTQIIRNSYTNQNVSPIPQNSCENQPHPNTTPPVLGNTPQNFVSPQMPVKKKSKQPFILVITSITVVILITIGIILTISYLKKEQEKREYEAKKQEMLLKIEELEKQRADIINENEKFEKLKKIPTEIVGYFMSLSDIEILFEKTWFNWIADNSDPSTDKYTKQNGVFHDDFYDVIKKFYLEPDTMQQLNSMESENSRITGLLNDLKPSNEHFQEFYDQVLLLHEIQLQFYEYVNQIDGNLSERLEQSKSYLNRFLELSKNLEKITPDLLEVPEVPTLEELMEEAGVKKVS